MNDIAHILNEVLHSKQKITWWLALTLIWLDGVLCGQLLSLF